MRRDASPLLHVLLGVFSFSFFLPFPHLIVTRLHLRLHCSWHDRLRTVLLLSVPPLLLLFPLLVLVKLQSCAAEVRLLLPGAEVAGRLGALWVGGVPVG